MLGEALDDNIIIDTSESRNFQFLWDATKHGLIALLAFHDNVLPLSPRFTKAISSVVLSVCTAPFCLL